VNRLVPTLIDGLRVALLRPPRRAAAVEAGAGTFVALVAVYLAVAYAVARLDAGGGALNPAGVQTVLADALLTLVAAWLLCRLAGRGTIAWGAAAVLLAATAVTALAIHWPLGLAATALARHGHVAGFLLLELASRAWWFFVLLAFAHWLAPRGLGRALGAAVLAYAVSAAAWWWLAPAPLLGPPAVAGSAAGDAGDTEVPPEENPPSDAGDEAQAPAFDAEEIMFGQAAMLDRALAALAPQRPGKPDLYVVAFAGDANEAVFRNEAEYAERLFSSRFGAEGRVLVLQNAEATVTTRPLATWTNLHYALEGIARKMDPAEDILLVYLTTHGSQDHQLLVDLEPLPLDQIEPVDLADALRTTPAVRWKVLVVNACYAGGFVDALRDDSTMVIAAARADRTSFGCGTDSDITYFGKAFLAEALNETTSLREAFDRARSKVAAWEAADKVEPSEPQIASSRSVEAKLEAWQRTLAPAPPVPFAPAAAEP